MSHPYDGWAANTSAYPSTVCTEPTMHPGRCNLTLWASDDDAASWTALGPVEPNAHEDAAYSALLPVNGSHALVAWERAGYETISASVVPLKLPRR